MQTSQAVDVLEKKYTRAQILGIEYNTLNEYTFIFQSLMHKRNQTLADFFMLKFLKL